MDKLQPIWRDVAHYIQKKTNRVSEKKHVQNSLFEGPIIWILKPIMGHAIRGGWEPCGSSHWLHPWTDLYPITETMKNSTFLVTIAIKGKKNLKTKTKTELS